MNEELTTFRHNLCLHNVLLTDVAIATINKLDARHPVRRVLQHTFHTLLIGNRENISGQLAGPLSFAVTLFSHPTEEVSAIAKKRLADLDLFDFDPDEQFVRRGTTETPFAVPLPRQRPRAVAGHARLRARRTWPSTTQTTTPCGPTRRFARGPTSSTAAAPADTDGPRAG